MTPGLRRSSLNLRLSLTVAALAPLAAGCGETEKDNFGLQILTPPARQQDAFAGAARVVLQANGVEVSNAPYVPGKGFSLNAKNLGSADPRTVVFRVRALDAEGRLVAFGQTPALDVVEASPQVSIFVQRPGTFALAPPVLERPVTGMAVVAAAAPFVAAEGQLKLADLQTVITFGGEERFTRMGMPAQDAYSPLVRAWNPLRLGFDRILDTIFEVELFDTINTPPTLPRFRKNTAAFAYPDGRVLLFGGLAKPEPTAPAEKETVTDQLDLLLFSRTSYLESGLYFHEAYTAPGVPEIARHSTALAGIGASVYAIGGYAGVGAAAMTKPLDTIVTIASDIAGRTASLRLSPVRLVAPRAAHTATAVETGDERGVLIFGGASGEAAPVAELFEPGANGGTVSLPAGDPGPMRRLHAALRLGPTNASRVLHIGGEDASGAPLATSVVYDPQTKSLAPGPITLVKARSEPIAFVIGSDLVVAGGRDAAGNLLGEAEIFDLMTLAPVGTTPCVPRRGAGVATISGIEGALVMGGEALVTTVTDGVTTTATGPTNLIELYQPRRL